MKHRWAQRKCIVHPSRHHIHQPRFSSFHPFIHSSIIVLPFSLGSSVAQVHRAVLTEKYGGPREVAVKIQRPSIESKLMGDIANLKAIAKQFQDLDALPLDYYTVFSELESQLSQEFDFVTEATNMERIYNSLTRSADGIARTEPPLIMPRVVPGLVSRRVLVMDYLHGVPLSRLVCIPLSLPIFDNHRSIELILWFLQSPG